MKRKEKLELRLAEMMDYEKALWDKNLLFVAGVDEVGRGCIAGPVVAACVILPKGWDIVGLDDSKKLSEKRREEMYEIIKEKAIAISVGIIDNKRIDEINILNATKEAMRGAIIASRVKLKAMKGSDADIQHLLIDAVKLDDVNIPQKSIIKGDAKSISIAAASIVAKVSRDRFMKEMAEEFTGYGFERNKGYGTKEHYQAIEKQGICNIHRKTFLKNI